MTSTQSIGSRRSGLQFKALHISAIMVFAVSAAITLYFARTMSGSMRMPGGWRMSMAWMHMGSWFATASMFCVMWAAMMVFMMLPSSWPVLMLTRHTLRFRGERHPELLTWTVAGGYFLTWTAFGLVAFVVGLALAKAAMASQAFSRAVPLLSGAVVIVAGIYQLLPIKSACLRHCRDPLLLVAHAQPGWRGAFRVGLHHGAFCVACCWALMAVQLVLGVMSLPLMIAVAGVIAWEKLSASGTLPARISGAVAVAAGGWVVLAAVLRP